MVVSPTGFSDFTLGNYMIGAFDDGNGLVNSQSVGTDGDLEKSAAKAAAVLTCNYLAFAKRQNCSLAEINNVLTPEEMPKAKALFPIAIN